MNRYRVVARHGAQAFMSTAVPVIGHDAPESEWLAARRAGIGASEIASVCNVPGAFSSPFALWWAKRLGWETERTLAMRVGQLLEEPIGILFAEQYPGITLVRPLDRLYRHPDHAWMLASPDFLAVEECGVCMGRGYRFPVYPGQGGTSGPMEQFVCDNCSGAGGWIEPVECKSDEGKDWGDTPPLKHVMQTWQQGRVFGARRGHLVRLAAKRLSAYIVDPDDGAWAEIVALGAAFAARVESGEAPDVDGHDATEDALRRLFPAPVEPTDPRAEVTVRQMLLAEFRAAHEARATANARFDEVRNRVREAMGDARFAVDLDGRRSVEHRQYKRSGYVVAPTVIDEIRKAW